MLAAQAAYGADASASQIDGLALGRRLFPLFREDESDRQPVYGGEGRFALVADVRLDNREELCASLGIDSSESATLADSQLLLRALERWEEAALERFVGDFAFAFYDAGKRQLLLARDPLGQRPLFWHRGRHFAAFSSMAKGLHALPDIERRPDVKAVARFTAGLPQEGASSWFEGIERVEPGHSVMVTSQEERRRRYWVPRRRDLKLKTFDEYVEAYRAELDRAVGCRLRGAGGLAAAHLSGGWDSSSVAATAARLMEPEGGRIVALTSVPREGAGSKGPTNRFSDEGPLAAATAALYPNIDHVLVANPDRSPVKDLDNYAELFERPLYNLCNHVWLSEIRAAAATKGARVLLSGEIGNWTISASPNALLADFLREGRWRDWAGAAATILRSGRGRLRGVAVSSFGPWLPRSARRRLLHFSPDSKSGVATPLNRSWTDIVREREERDFETGWPRNHFEHSAAAIREMDWGELRKGILGGWGIDKRDPTADVRLIEFCLSLPLEMLLDGIARRPLARAALSDRLPPSVLDEKRRGYQGADWFTGLTADLPAVKALVEAIAADSTAAAVVDVDLLRQLIRAWPGEGWEESRTRAAYRIALLHGLSAGHFLLAASRASRRPVQADHSRAG
ncbi:MAG TPA: asparagine synthase-related protein [Allosphingosinicella sp.]